MARIDVNYELMGIVNNAEINITGKGQVDTTTGRYEMELRLMSVPFCWDPAFNFLMTDTGGAISHERGNALSIISQSDGRHGVNWRGAYIYDQSGRHVGHLTASSKVVRKGNSISMTSHIHYGYIWLALNEEVIEIESPYQGIMIPREGVNFLTTSYSFKTNIGRYWGYTTYPYILENKKTIPGPQIMTFNEVTIRRQKDRFFYSRTSYVESLAVVDKERSVKRR